MRYNNASEVSAGKSSEGKESKVKCSAGKNSSVDSDEGYAHNDTHTMNSSAAENGGTVMSFLAEGGYYRMTSVQPLQCRGSAIKEQSNGVMRAAGSPSSRFARRRSL